MTRERAGGRARRKRARAARAKRARRAATRRTARGSTNKSGAKQFIGEDRIDHTPRDEKIRIKMGEAFDVVGDRKQMAWRTLGGCQSESDWEIELRNHKDKAESVEIFEPIGGDWTILQSSHTHKKRDAFTFTFDVNVPARGKVKVTYKVRVRWC